MVFVDFKWNKFYGNQLVDNFVWFLNEYWLNLQFAIHHLIPVEFVQW